MILREKLATIPPKPEQGHADEDGDEIESVQEALATVTRKLKITENALGVSARRKLEDLKGNVFLRHRMNARALKERIRAKLIAHKFERRKLERIYRHQIMRKSVLFVQ